MIALFSLIWTAMRSAFDPTLPSVVKSFRIIVCLLAMAVMGIVVFWRQRLLRAELSLFLAKSRRSFEELKAVQDKLIQSEKLASLGQLVGGAAHEINNPLTAMLGYSDLLSASNLPPAERLQAAQIGEQVRRTTTLVASLLTFAHREPAKLAAVDINSVLQTAVRLLTPQLEAESSSICLELSPALPRVLADSNQILHVCLHLAGQVGAHLDRVNQSTLFVRTHGKGNFILIDFSSSDPTSTPLAFPSVFHSDGENKPATLSLSACCRIVEEHGGRLLQPAPGQSAFRMELRVVPISTRRSTFADSTPAVSGSSA
jgi:two-component system NtrC family sensor kinase